MRVEARRATKDGKKYIRGLVLFTDSEEESALIDEVFGKKMQDADGLQGTLTVEARLSDGYGEHYLYVKAEEPS